MRLGSGFHTSISALLLSEERVFDLRPSFVCFKAGFSLSPLGIAIALLHYTISSPRLSISMRRSNGRVNSVGLSLSIYRELPRTANVKRKSQHKNAFSSPCTVRVRASLPYLANKRPREIPFWEKTKNQSGLRLRGPRTNLFRIGSLTQPTNPMFEWN